MPGENLWDSSASHCWNKVPSPYILQSQVCFSAESAPTQRLLSSCKSSHLVYVLSLLLHGFQDVLRWVPHVDDCLHALPLAGREGLLYVRSGATCPLCTAGVIGHLRHWEILVHYLQGKTQRLRWWSSFASVSPFLAPAELGHPVKFGNCRLPRLCWGRCSLLGWKHALQVVWLPPHPFYPHQDIWLPTFPAIPPLLLAGLKLSNSQPFQQ